VILLTAFVAIVWLGVVESEYSTAFQKSRMAVAGKTITTTIVTYQFIAIQLIAIIMLSTSISDEIHHRTLGLLMTTPISSFHIVMGKLFSKLLQLILLLAISLPLLAIVRVFGGVPWDYLLSSLCITLTAVIFAGSLSLFFSINNRRAFVVIIKTAVTLGVLFFFLPTIISALSSPWWLTARARPNFVSPALIVFVHLNPFSAMFANTAMMMSPAGAAAIPSFYWPVHCALMLGVSALLIALSVKIVRKVALRQATGQPNIVPKHRRSRKRKKPSLRSTEPQEQAGVVRRVKGSPVLWKELRAPMIRGVDRRNSIIGLTVAIVALFITYGVCVHEECLDQDFTHISYTLMFVVIGSIFSMVLSTTCITSERESRTWPIILATSMDDWHILLGKAVGVFRRCLPIWLLLAGHVVLFVLFRYIHPIAIFQLFMLVAGLVVFLIGVGLYFSTRFRRTTSAVVANFALALVLWAVIPGILGLVSQFTRDYDALGAYVSANPVTQATVIMSGAGGRWNARAGLSSLDYDWPSPNNNWHKVGPATGVLVVYMLIYMAAGFLFAWRAKCRFRRNIF
jgi:ABC-type transport system involved in multi-copper enzyme maturation permease subunit